MSKIVFHDEASEEYIENYAWYYKRGHHIAEAFEHEMEQALAVILEAPERWPMYVSNWRRVLLRRFPFGVVYGMRDGAIVIIAIMHMKRRPGYWKNRVLDVVAG